MRNITAKIRANLAPAIILLFTLFAMGLFTRPASSNSIEDYSKAIEFKPSHLGAKEALKIATKKLQKAE